MLAGVLPNAVQLARTTRVIVPACAPSTSRSRAGHRPARRGDQHRTARCDRPSPARRQSAGSSALPCAPTAARWVRRQPGADRRRYAAPALSYVPPSPVCSQVPVPKRRVRALLTCRGLLNSGPSATTPRRAWTHGSSARHALATGAARVMPRQRGGGRYTPFAGLGFWTVGHHCRPCPHDGRKSSTWGHTRWSHWTSQ
jgi:hypothetical protein